MGLIDRKKEIWVFELERLVDFPELDKCNGRDGELPDGGDALHNEQVPVNK
jgi:hypothetical protein